MTIVDIIMAVGGSGTLIGVLGWAVKLQERVKVLEIRDQDYVTLVNQQFSEVKSRLDRIERNQNHGSHE